jgi:hypothetical protein
VLHTGENFLIAAEAIKERNGITDLENKLQKLRSEWLGHMQTEQNSRSIVEWKA